MKLKDVLKVIQDFQKVEICYKMSDTVCYLGSAEYALKLNHYILKSDVVFCKVYRDSTLYIIIK